MHNVVIPKNANDPWYARLILAMATREGIMTTMVVVIISGAAGVSGWLAVKHGGPYIEAATAKLLAEAAAATTVADAVVELKKLASKQDERDELLKNLVTANQKLIELGNNQSATNTKILEGATELMRPVPALRESELKVSVESSAILKQLRDINIELLQAIKDAAKNADPSLQPNNGGA